MLETKALAKERDLDDIKEAEVKSTTIKPSFLNACLDGGNEDG